MTFPTKPLTENHTRRKGKHFFACGLPNAQYVIYITQ